MSKPQASTSHSDPYLIGFTQVNGQWYAVIRSNTEVLVEGGERYTSYVLIDAQWNEVGERVRTQPTINAPRTQPPSHDWDDWLK